MHQSEESDGEDYAYLSEDEDYLNAGKRRLKRRTAAARRVPPLITFAELYEQALVLDEQRKKQRNSRIFFDANDEYIRAEQVPELVQLSSRNSSEEDESFEDDLEEQRRIQDTIEMKYRIVDVFFGDE